MSEPSASKPQPERDPVVRSPLGLLALQALPGVGPAGALRAALVTTNYDALMDKHADRWAKALDDAHAELEAAARKGVTALCLFDERYPGRLRAIHDPPPVLFVHGSIDVLAKRRTAAVVGTREPTSFGCSATENITAALARAGWAVISGLAKGIDTLAHGAALKHQTETVAVMAGGLDRIYPAENKELAAAIVDKGGALVAEQRWGAAPQRSAFVQRNRIQTALSAAVVVAQTGVVGGTMHTVRHAVTQGRPLFCPVPHAQHEKNMGLETLLHQPGQSLCGVLPAFKDSGALCRRLGREPVARAVTRDDLDEFIDALELALDCEPQTEPQSRWWPYEDPPADIVGRDAVSDDDKQQSLFASAF